MKTWMMALALIAAAACSRAKPPPQAAPVTVAPAPAAPVKMAATMADPVGPEVVLDKLHSLDTELIDASKLAEKSARSRKVKKLAKSLISARTRSEAELVAMAAKLSVSLKDPAALALAAADKAQLAASRDAFSALPTKSGESFDASYLGSVDAALKGELGLLSQISATATSADLKALSAKLGPQVTAREKTAADDLKSMTKSAG